MLKPVEFQVVKLTRYINIIILSHSASPKFMDWAISVNSSKHNSHKNCDKKATATNYVLTGRQLHVKR